jgi:hypothetical protein
VNTLRLAASSQFPYADDRDKLIKTLREVDHATA